MALSGTLADVAVVDLLQLPHVGRRTGRMTMTHGPRVAHVFFVDGAITHAALEADRGMDVLVELLDWTEGDFQFETGVTTTEITIKTDLHRSIMLALKARDERQEERRAHSASRTTEDVTRERLERFVTATTTARDVAWLTRDGHVLARAIREPEVEGIDSLRAAILRIFTSHPRSGLARVITIDDAGAVVGQAMESGILVLVFTSETAVGVAMHAVGKLTTELSRGGSAR